MSPQSSTKTLDITRVTTTESEAKPDIVCVEEPLEIRLGYGPLDDRQQWNAAVTMRTPGHDRELAVGFLYNEGILPSYDDVVRMEYCRDEQGALSDNILRIELRPEIEIDKSQHQRNFYTTSSCGVCGKASLEAIEAHCQPVPVGELRHRKSVVFQLGEVLRSKQLLFKHTGGIHACGLFDTNGNLMALREDVGRHNAMDKLSGYALEQIMQPLCDHILMLSGRASFELIQKAAMTGIGTVVAVGAPSSLAIECARNFGITLIGFAKKKQFNVYTAPERIVISSM